MKLKLSVYKIALGTVWAVCLGAVGLGMMVFGPSTRAAVEQARRTLKESQDQLAFAQSAQKEETKQRMRDRLTQTQNSLNAFSCPAASESALIFQVGQLAQSLRLKNFNSRFPNSAPEPTLDKNERISEGWLSVECVADYLKLAAFINGLERHEPVLFVESIQLEPADDNSGEAAAHIMLSYLIRRDRAVAAASPK